MFPMHCSFWRYLDVLRDSAECEPYLMTEFPLPGFPIHPSASEIAEQMLVDPDVLKNETYEPGIYDEQGDYYPQFSDDPDSMPDYIEPTPLAEAVPEPTPANDPNSPDVTKTPVE